MDNFVPYSSNMHPDLEPYSDPQEQHMDYPHSNQPFLPVSPYGMDNTFNPSYDPIMSMAEAQPPPHLQYHYQTIAQDANPFHHQTPAGSPHSASHSLHEQPPVLSASPESGASVPSSATGSPTYYNDSWNPMQPGLTSSFDYPAMTTSEKTHVDPSVIQPFAFAPLSPYLEIPAPSFCFPVIEQPPSPALSHISSQSLCPGSTRTKQGSASPYLRTQRYHPYQHMTGHPRGSMTSQHSPPPGTSRKSGTSHELDDELSEKDLCPLPYCGREFKDLKAHLLTHRNERPEKCPIATCKYHIKGFARRYDKNRHTLTHYKGTMVCGFCAGSGSAAEKSFNRADVFKRHLTSVHGVDQNASNSRKKSLSGHKSNPGPASANMPGTCSTCSITFANPQEFYEHLDNCVLRVVQQANPSEAINQRLLPSVAEDKEVTETLDRNGLSKSIEYTVPLYNENEEEDVVVDDDDDDDDDDDFDNDDHNDYTYGSRRSRSGKGFIKSTKQNQH